MCYEKKLKDMKNAQLHCCSRMNFELLGNSKVLFYSPKIREYSFTIPNSSVCIVSNFCVFCDQKLPDSLRSEWFWFLTSEFNIESPFGRDESKIPVEFLTDEWWKTRSLMNESVRQTIKKTMIEADPDEWDEKIKRNHLWEIKKANYRGSYCCLVMDRELAYGAVVRYVPYLREYQIQSNGFLVLDYCPFCGKREPQSLRKKWLEILSADYGLVDPLGKDKSKVPQDFLTDEWWKKREL